MASNYDHVEGEDEGFMHMNSSSFSSDLFCNSANTYSSREFEFIPNDQESEFVIFPADELFYEGKVLPLHLSPRLQMLQSLLQNSTPTPIAQACNVSPSESLCVTSDKLNDYFFAQLSNDNFIVGDSPKKSRPKKKLQMIKKFLGGQNLMAYRARLKSFLSESSCTNESSAIASPQEREVGNISKSENDFLSQKVQTSKKISGGQIAKETKSTLGDVKNLISREKVGFENPCNIRHRRSLCGVIKPVKCLSSSSSACSSFSCTSSSSYGQNLHKRRDSFGSDTEGSIDAAIAHCKKSQQNTDDTESGYWSFSVSRTADCIRD
ncbi:hypothetical protein AgCh_036292 [Apium graveolens]